MNDALLVIDDVHKAYAADVIALRGVSLAVARGEIVCLLGPSGCGKTTLLRIVAGLEQPDSGRIRFAGRNLADVPVYQRGFGLMFQEFALFPDKSVGQNVAFGLRMARWDAAAIAQRVDEMLALVNLRGYGARSIFDLSGGERQRVALARSLAPSPALLMLDEPLGSLDRALRESLMDELRTLLKRLGLTSLYVTHDQQEALAVADRVVLMNDGRIVQQGAPQEIYLAPANAFVARFLGYANLLPVQGVKAVDGAVCVETEVGSLPTALAASASLSTQPHVLLVRPTALVLGDEAAQTVATGAPLLTGTVAKVAFRGGHQRVEIALPGRATQEPLVFEAPLVHPPCRGNSADLRSRSCRVHAAAGLMSKADAIVGHVS